MREEAGADLAGRDARPVLVVDFGAQYAQLIARRVREARVYSEIVPHSITAAEVRAKDPGAIILSGGPASVYAPGAPNFDDDILQLGIPVFGICYGFQAMAQGLGGSVARTGGSEYGGTTLTVGQAGTLLAGLPDTQNVWMSHGDSVEQAPEGFEVLSPCITPNFAHYGHAVLSWSEECKDACDAFGLQQYTLLSPVKTAITIRGLIAIS